LQQRLALLSDLVTEDRAVVNATGDGEEVVNRAAESIGETLDGVDAGGCRLHFQPSNVSVADLRFSGELQLCHPPANPKPSKAGSKNAHDFRVRDADFFSARHDTVSRSLSPIIGMTVNS
jgi:hypothetical protein